MAVSLPSDFTPIPQVLLPKARQAFVARALSNAFIGSGSGFPVQMMNDPGFINGGQYLSGPTFKQLLSATRRDITSTSALTASKVEGVDNQGVICNRRSQLVEFADDSYIAGFSREAISAELGRQAGEMVADDMLSTIIAAIRGLVEAVGSSAHISNVWAASGTRTNLSPSSIDGGRFLMGDAMARLTHILTRSEAWRDMRSHAVGQAYDTVGGVALKGDMNANNDLVRTIRDDASLTDSDAGFDKYFTMLMGAGILEVFFVKPMTIETDRRIDNETKKTQWRVDWDLGLRCPHMKYNSGAGGANPTNATLKSSANWTDTMSNHKELALVEIQHNYSNN